MLIPRLQWLGGGHIRDAWFFDLDSCFVQITEELVCVRPNFIASLHIFAIIVFILIKHWSLSRRQMFCSIRRISSSRGQRFLNLFMLNILKQLFHNHQRLFRSNYLQRNDRGLWPLRAGMLLQLTVFSEASYFSCFAIYLLCSASVVIFFNQPHLHFRSLSVFFWLNGFH